MNKNIFLSVALSMGLMFPVGLESSSVRNWIPQGVRQGLSSMYSSMTNFFTIFTIMVD